MTLWSYVDNIEITSPTAESAIESLHGLERFAALMDVQIDTDKTYLWSTDAECRRTIRQADFAIRQYARDLGGHVQYNLKVTNSTVTAKIAKMGPLWNKLSRSLAGYGQKVRACRAKAWPRCLHAVEIVHLADEHYEALRTGLMKALAANKSGASPIIHLSLIEATKTDPQFYALVSTVLTFRQYMTVETASFVLGEIHQDLRQRPRPGPCAVMLSRLQQIGWDWSHEAVFKDHMMSTQSEGAVQSKSVTSCAGMTNRHFHMPSSRSCHSTPTGMARQNQRDCRPPQIVPRFAHGQCRAHNDGLAKTVSRRSSHNESMPKWIVLYRRSSSTQQTSQLEWSMPTLWNARWPKAPPLGVPSVHLVPPAFKPI